MPYGDPDFSDPTLLVGAVVPAEAETMRLMAEVFAEEFARLGFDRHQILRLFERPFYAGAHRAGLELGAAAIEQIVDQSLAVWGRVRYVDRDPVAGAPELRRRDCGDGLVLLEPDSRPGRS
jgi:hypothetical protein